jgi:predicted dehydrogenase
MKQLSLDQPLSRRQFIKGAAMAGAVAAPTLITSSALGAQGRASASNRIAMGVIGLGTSAGRGRYVMRGFMAQPDVQVVAVCDVSRANRETGRDEVNLKYDNKDCDAYLDFQEMLARPDIDAVVLATGENWHSALSIMAAQAGKDIYCEKPMSVAVNESRAVADAMPRFGRVFQCGTQSRSLSNYHFAVQLARSGKLGQLREVHAEELSLTSMYDTMLPAEPEPPREELDWNRWLGPAQWRPYNKKWLERYGFYYNHYDLGGGSITEWGCHTIDQCQWANDADDTGPVEFWREGKQIQARYANGVKLVIRKGFTTGGGVCVRFEGDEGWVETGVSGEVNAHPKSLLGERGLVGLEMNWANNHARGFLDSVKTRQRTIANADVAHRSVSVCHLANLCRRLDRPIKWDPVKEECIGDDEANRLCLRSYREPWYV